MSIYCAKADMVARFQPRTLVQLTDRPADDTVPVATAITDSVLDQAIGDASDLIDTYLAVVTTLPIDPVPPRLVACCCTIVLASLYQDAIPEKVAKDRDREIAWLRDVRDNKIRLFPDGTPTAGDGEGLVMTNGSTRMFTRDSLKDAL
jgi:phage gp36-like protein